MRELLEFDFLLFFFLDNGDFRRPQAFDLLNILPKLRVTWKLGAPVVMLSRTHYDPFHHESAKSCGAFSNGATSTPFSDLDRHGVAFDSVYALRRDAKGSDIVVSQRGS